MDIRGSLYKEKYPDFVSRRYSNHRRKSIRLGGGTHSSERSEVYSRLMEYRRKKPTHKQFGIYGNSKSNKKVRVHPQRQTSVRHVGQHHNNSYIEKNGISQVSTQTRPISRIVQNPNKVQYSSESLIHKRSGQSSSGLSVKRTPSNSDGARIIRNNFTSDFRGAKPLSSGRPICIPSKSQASAFLLSHKARESLCLQRLRSKLGEFRGSLRIPSASPSSKGTSKMEKGEEGSSYSHSTSVETLLLDKPLEELGDPILASQPVTTRHVSTNTGREEIHLQQKILPQRVSFIRALLKYRNNKKLVDRLCTSVSKSSLITYQFYWSKFYKFIVQNDLFYTVSPDYILEFFHRLIDEGTSYNYLVGIRSALSIPLKLLWPKYDMFSDINIQLLFSHFKSHNKKPRKYFPKWNLDTVTDFLISEKFIDKCKDDIDLFFKKVLFFTLLACPKRISEFSAITIADSIFRKDISVTLKPHPKFFAKNHSFNFCPKDIIIPSNSGSKACPVALLQDYLRLSEETCLALNVQRPPQLWINKKGIPLSTKQLNHWFRSIVLMGDPEARKADVSFHSMRGVAASNLFRHFDIDTVIEAMGWKAPSTFVQYYAKLGCTSKMNLVVAGKIIN